MLTTALIAMFLLILTGCMTWNNAAGSISLPVLLTIACSFGVSEALQASGAAQQLADFIVDVFSFSRIGLLFGIYIGTALLSAVITNNAAVALMFPIVADPVTGIIYTQKLNPYAALYTMMLAASASFSTPIGYQTNLMVHGPGGYTFNDWVIFGVPLQLLLCVVSVVLAFYVFPSP
uniref:Citrate transporter-like domain-containing protein n=1 Tax=Timspurckia oligopyrenoides TaxID=708627 RepID=A0A7S1ET59_9RHOD